MSEESQSSAEIKHDMARALNAIRKLKGRIAAREAAEHEPIAVLGIGCRLPGGADNPRRFWRLLRDGTDATSDMPRNRLSGIDYLNADPDVPGKAYVMRGGFIDGVDQFDPELFGISPREAVGMDPQQRIALETSWEALENAAIAPDGLRGRRMAVYMGASTNDYVRMRQQLADPATIDAHQFYGETSFIAGRIAYSYGTHGPAEMIDTSCSSSLVAVHRALRSLRAGESDLVLAGGVNLILSPYGFVLVSKLRAVSPDGRCKTFDAAADGYARGEGCGILVLKRLSDARHDGDPILGVILGSAVNHDGPSSGITVPNASAQQEVIRAALADARLAPAEIDYVEAHGTGTGLGDPIELRALDAVLGASSGRKEPLMVGSLKTNIGHLEPVAGVAGLIKLILSLHHEEIPPHINLNTPNPKVDWDRLNLHVTTVTTPWLAGERPRYGGVSSFGVSGTNAHVIAGGAPRRIRPVRTAERRWQILTISGCGEASRRQIAGRLERFVTENLDTPLVDICYSANTGRARLGHRFAAVTESVDMLRAQLASYSAHKLPENAVEGTVARGTSPQLAFLFPGQGSQYPGMARELMAAEPVFRAALERCNALQESLLGRSLIALLYDTDAIEADALLANTRYTQPAVFAVEYALAQLWLQRGLKPAALTGHSFGEIVAACVAEALSLEDAVTLVDARARLIARLPESGAMLAINATEAAIAEAIAEIGSSVEIAAVNGPEDVVGAGSVHAVQELAALLTDRGVRVTRLRVSHPFHSAAMEPILAEFGAVAAGLNFTAPKIPVIANVTGVFHTSETIADPAYWCAHLRQAVRFGDGLRTLSEAGVGLFLEVGAHPVLSPLVARNPETADAIRIVSMKRSEAADYAVAMASAQLFVHGLELDFVALHAGDSALRVVLPSYAFQRQRYWFDMSRQGAALHATAGAMTGSPLLGTSIDGPEPLFRAVLTAQHLRDMGAIVDDGIVVIPNAELAMLPFELARAAFEEQRLALSIAAIAPVLAVRDHDTLELQTNARALPGGGWQLCTHARTASEIKMGLAWRLVLDARFSPMSDAKLDADLSVFARSCTESVPVPGSLTLMGVDEIWRGDIGTLVKFDPDLCEGVMSQPGLVAAGLAAARGVPAPQALRSLKAARLGPIGLDAARVLTLSEQQMSLFDGGGVEIARADAISCSNVPTSADLAEQLVLPDVFYTLDWEDRPNRGALEATKRVLILGDSENRGSVLADYLRAAGWDCEVIVLSSAELHDRTVVRHHLTSALGRDGAPLAQVIYLGGLDLPRPDATTFESVAAARYMGTAPVVVLIQELVAASPETRPKLWFATLGAQPAGKGPQPLCVTGGPMWGLGKSIALEHSEYWGGMIDLDPSAADPMAELAQELICAGVEDQIAFRDGKRYVQRLNPWDGVNLPKKPVKPDPKGWYLITGGMGAVGLAVARWLVQNGVGGVAITGRRALCEVDEANTILDELRMTGADIRYFQVDAIDIDGTRSVVETLDSLDGGLRGVFHAAGTSSPQDLIDADPLTFERVMKPKVEGAWLIHDLTKDLDLQVFVVFSTIACVWGSQHVANYSAANQFLDVLAHHRRAQGLPSLVIDWGLWATGSHLFDAEVLRFLKSVGLKPMPTEPNINVLFRLLNSDVTQMVVAGVDWNRFKPLLEARGPRPLLEPIDTATRPVLAQSHSSEILCALEKVAPDERLGVMDGYVWTQFASLLGVETESVKAKLEDGGSLMDFGLDSLLVLDMVARCRKDLRLDIKADEFLHTPGLQWPSYLLARVTERKQTSNDASDEVRSPAVRPFEIS